MTAGRISVARCAPSVSSFASIASGVSPSRTTWWYTNAPTNPQRLPTPVRSAANTSSNVIICVSTGEFHNKSPRSHLPTHTTILHEKFPRNCIIYNPPVHEKVGVGFGYEFSVLSIYTNVYYMCIYSLLKWWNSTWKYIKDKLAGNSPRWVPFLLGILMFSALYQILKY